MTKNIELGYESPDPAGVFASALSLWQECQKLDGFNLSESFNGVDQFMREVMRVGELFEKWACQYIDFNETSEVWSYMLEERFGKACLAVMFPELLGHFDQADCLRVAINLGLPVKSNGDLPLPVDVWASNPNPDGFVRYRIQTVRSLIGSGYPVPFIRGDDPFDEIYGKPFFSFYGEDRYGMIEHIADRSTYDEVVKLAKNVCASIEFPKTPTFRPKLSSSVSANH